MPTTRVSCSQVDVIFGDPVANAEAFVIKLRELKSQGVQVAVFPEAALTGYCTASAEAAAKIAIPLDHGAVRLLDSAVQELGMVAIVGFAERAGEKLYNSAAILESGKPPRRYRKVHLPCMGLDRFVAPGAELPVFDTQFGRIGVLICYDLRPPEAARVLTLAGTDIIALPTNWPVGAECSADHICIARAAENRVFLLACNRAGSEHGFNFIGRSKIIDPTGKLLATAQTGVCDLIADLDLELACQKRTVNIPGEYEVDVIGCRRPELYNTIREPA